MRDLYTMTISAVFGYLIGNSFADFYVIVPLAMGVGTGIGMFSVTFFNEDGSWRDE